MDLTELDATDREIMLFVTRGYSSSYSIWSAMKKEAGENRTGKVMTYRNTNKRVVRLSNLRLLEEIKPRVYSVHGKKDYRLTMKGLEELIPHILTHPKGVQNVVQYMDKFGLSKYHFWDLIFRKIYLAVNSTNEFSKHAKLPGIGDHKASFDNILYVSKEKPTPDIVIKMDAERYFDKTDKIKHSIESLHDVLDPLNTEQKTDRIIKFTKELLFDLNSSMVPLHLAEVKETERMSLRKEEKVKSSKLRKKIEDTTKTLDQTVAATNEAAESFRRTVDEMKERASNFQETIKRTPGRKKK